MRKCRRVITCLVILGFCITGLVANSFAVIKEVYVWGVKSINDRGGSDYRITMDQLEADYFGYIQTDGLTEWFHKDQSDPALTNTSEALYWLIANNIISRDNVVTLTNIDDVPDINITKYDMSVGGSLLYKQVRRSDALMYIYKSAFGPLDGRTVGVETVTVRTDQESGSDPVEKTLEAMIQEHNYSMWNHIYGHDSASEGEFGLEGSVSGGEGGAPGSAGGDGGDADIISNYENDANAWRYTPQGELYTSIFGDTNIFISENHFTQDSSGGIGGSGGAGGAGGDAGDATAEANGDESNASPEANSIGGSGGAGGGGGGGGAAQNIIEYETDYKSVYLIPGADFWVYNTNDVLEPYLQSLYSMGLLDSDKDTLTDEFLEMVEKFADDSTLIPAWSGSADTFFVNLDKGKHTRVENVVSPYDDGGSSSDLKLLGENYKVSWDGDTLTIQRKDLFESHTKYFKSEVVSKIDIYRYIYNMVSASEKKLTDLEANLVNYKYGTVIDSSYPTRDAEVLKYLVAKGILNYDGSSDLEGLYTSMSWSELIPVLYRVANPEARLDFSVITLTDSETFWQAAGFGEGTARVVTSDVVSSFQFEYESGYIENSIIGNEEDDPNGYLGDEGSTTYTITGYIGRAMTKLSSVLSSGISKLFGISFTNTQNPLVSVASASTSSTSGSSSSSGEKVGDIIATAKAGYIGVGYEVWFDFGGAYDIDQGDAYIVGALKAKLAELDANPKYMDTAVRAISSSGYDDSNPLHYIKVRWLQNGHVMSYVQNSGNNTLVTEMKEAINEWAQETPPETWTSTQKEAKEATANELLTLCEKMKTWLDGSNGNATAVMKAGTYTVGESTFKCIGGSGVSFAAIFGALMSFQIKERVTITFEYSDSDYTIVYEPYSGPETFTIIGMSEEGVEAINTKISGDLKLAVTTTDIQNDDTTEVFAKAKAQYTPLVKLFTDTDTSSYSGTGSAVANAASKSVGIKIDQNDSSQAYIAFSEIQKATNYNVIQQEASVLYNKQNGIRAVFIKEEGQKYSTMAIVGGVVISGEDLSLGLSYEDTSSTSGESYYALSAIRQLVSFSQSLVLCGGQYYVVSDTDFDSLYSGVVDNAREYNVINASGTSTTQMTSVKVGVQSLGITQEEITRYNTLLAQDLNTKYQCLNSGEDAFNTRFCNYLKVSTGSKVINAIYRKFTYSVDSTKLSSSGNVSAIAYGVVLFRPDEDLVSEGTATVDSNTSLQDLLDSPAISPTDTHAKALWEENMRQCNVYTNWIYGTVDSTYVNTGYLKPEVYLFVLGDATVYPPSKSSMFKNISEEDMNRIDIQSTVELNAYTAPTDAYPGDESYTLYNSSAAQINESESRVFVSERYEAVITGDTLFLCDAMFDNISFVKGSRGTDGHYNITSMTVNNFTFNVGSTFKLFEDDQPVIGNPTAIVTEVNDKGKVKIQVGPFYGMPVKYNNNVTLVTQTAATSGDKLSDAEWTVTIPDLTDLSAGIMSTNYKAKLNAAVANCVDYWEIFYNLCKSSGITGGWVTGESQKKIIESPIMFATSSGGNQRRLVFNGDTINMFQGMTVDSLTIDVPTSSGSSVFSGSSDGIKETIQETMSHKIYTDLASWQDIVTNTEVYFEIELSGWSYKIVNGVLKYTTTSESSSFLSPWYFTSINDLVVDGILSATYGAIPVNEIDEGKILMIGDYAFQAVNMQSEDTSLVKSFVGYTKLDAIVDKPTAAHASVSFANVFVAAGSQYINISHFFKQLIMLKNEDEPVVLNHISDNTMKSDNNNKISLDYTGGRTQIVSTGDGSTKIFSPVRIVFSDGLKAYPSGTLEDGTVVYILCNDAEAATTGVLDNESFLPSGTISLNLTALTTDVVSTKFQRYGTTSALMENIKLDFNKAFQGDLITLIRMLLFIVITWLVLASWVCYGARLMNLIPILDSIKHPSNKSSLSGLDLFKIISLGTISLETEFTLGRFLQYNFFMAILLCIIMLIG